MKKTFQNLSRKCWQRGVALILVLGALVLISAIVIGFLSTVRQDRTSAAYYESGSTARQYADTAVTIAIAQIAEATSNPDQIWVSQPGLLRTFTANGTVAAYKLYSSDTMKITGVFNPETALSNEIPTTWSTRPDEFADLNAPVQVTMNGTVQSIYPIVNPAAVSDVEGFTLDSIIPTGTGSSVNSLPMPVRWIYVRKNGQLVDYTTAQGADDITARIAFWGDDETCKVNINTASDGVYYDAPVARSTEDHALANCQPIAQEYQRYPGHPATTSLASVFAAIRNETNPAQRSLLASQIAPRIGWGGSEGGTKQAWLTRNVGVLDFDRMFPSVDELVFGRSGGKWAVGSAAVDTRNPSPLALDVTRLPFFLTTDSRGPELNAFNRPRVTLWPFNTELVASPSGLTPEDLLIKQASELGSNQRKLYFQREDARDPTNDYTNIAENQQLYGYLQWLTQKSFPGDSTRTGSASATPNLETKFTALGRDQILTEMFDYLRCQVNTMNRSYEPVNGPVYSFPQNCDLNTIGFNDLCPIQINAGNGMTQGFGVGGITLKEFIMQFYNAGETTADLMNNTTGASGSDTKVDSIIRKVQVVILLDYTMSVNTLNSAQPVFQVKMVLGNGTSTAEGFYINPNPNGVPANDLDKVYVRYYSLGQADNVGWTTGRIELQFPPNSTNLYCSNDAQFDTSARTNLFGGSLGMSYGLRSRPGGNATSTYLSEGSAKKSFNSTISQDYRYYPFVSAMLEFRIPLQDLTGNATIKDPDNNKNSVRSSLTVNQTISANGTLTPDKISIPIRLESASTTTGNATFTPVQITMCPGLKKGALQLSTSNLNPLTTYIQEVHLQVADSNLPLPRLGPDIQFVACYNAANSPKSLYSALSDYSLRLDYSNTMPGDMMMLVPVGTGGWLPGGADTNALMDTFRSYTLSASTGAKGDFRLAAVKRDIPANWFEPNPSYYLPGTYFGMSYLPTYLARMSGPETIRHSATVSATGCMDLYEIMARPVAGLKYTRDLGASQRFAAYGMNGTMKSNGTEGDFTNGYAANGDGGKVRGVDIGAISWQAGDTPYYANRLSRSSSSDTVGSDIWHTNFTGLVYSPWKQMPSAVNFGSLPSRATTDDPWETLLFNPVPLGGRSSHRGWTQLPRDHYWLDLFYMPVVEPYAITENFATNGKINLNQQIAPFTYIRRNTGLWALLRNMKVLALPSTNAVAAAFKTSDAKPAGASAANYRKSVDVSSTVAQIQDRLKVSNDPFVTASEICEIPMLFDGKTPADIESHWNDLKLSGDDSREAPYNAIYPRVTTRSNSFKIHFVAQSLKGKGGKWSIVGQYRGSQVIERYLDGFSGGATAKRVYGTGSTPATQFPALAGHDATGVPYYRFRKLAHQQFAP
ncbi:MAG: Verru_Chthon cassette protein A [bacterium]